MRPSKSLANDSIMKLVIDRGNTLYKTAVFDRDELVWVEAFESLPIGELEKIFSDFAIGSSILCSVGEKEPKETVDFLKAESCFLSMDDALEFPVRIAYKTVSTLGKDRLASVVGANALLKCRDALVIDAGSCICYDYVDAEAVYRGGAIAPGFAMKYKALHTFTANLPLLDLRETGTDLCACSTEDCIRSGVENGTMFEIEGMVNEFLSLHKDAALVLSGGDAERIAERLHRDAIVEKHLVLKGLNVILDANTK